MGFFDDLEKAARFQTAIQASKDKSGKPNPLIATGLVLGMGYGDSPQDAILLTTMLGSQGAFDNKNKPD